MRSAPSAAPTSSRSPGDGVLDARATIPRGRRRRRRRRRPGAIVAARFHSGVAGATAAARAPTSPSARGLELGRADRRRVPEPAAARGAPPRARARRACACSCPSALPPNDGGDLLRAGRGRRGAQHVAALTNARKSSTTGRAGPTAARITCHARACGPGSTGITPSRPEPRSEVTASAERNEIPSPSRAAWRIAPLEPTVSVSPWRSCATGTPRWPSACRSRARAAATCARRAPPARPVRRRRADRPRP